MPGDGDPFGRILQALADAGLPHALIGAAARNAWAPPRLTTDLDVAVAADEREYKGLEAALAAAGYRPVMSHRVEPTDPTPAVTVFRNPDAPAPYRQVDILVAGTVFETEAIGRAIARPIGGLTARIITREDLVIYKLIAWRPRDRQDIDDVIATATAAGVELDCEYMRRWARAWQVEDRLDAALARAGAADPP